MLLTALLAALALCAAPPGVAAVIPGPSSCFAKHGEGQSLRLFTKFIEAYMKCEQQIECRRSTDRCMKQCDSTPLEGQQECIDACYTEQQRCYCECVVGPQAMTTTTSTTKRPTSTTPSTTTPSTTTPSTTTPSTTTPSMEDWSPQMHAACAQQCGTSGDGPLGAMRTQNCTCGCMGLPGGNGLYDHNWAERCEWQRDCSGREKECRYGCRSRHDSQCSEECALEALKCRCECRMAPVLDLKKIADCKARQQCDVTDCSKRDWRHLAKCRLNCECGCAGFFSNDLEKFDDWYECNSRKGCWRTLQRCEDNCKSYDNENCREQCRLEYSHCRCRCNLGYTYY